MAGEKPGEAFFSRIIVKKEEEDEKKGIQSIVRIGPVVSDAL